LSLDLFGEDTKYFCMRLPLDAKDKSSKLRLKLKGWWVGNNRSKWK